MIFGRLLRRVFPRALAPVLLALQGAMGAADCPVLAARGAELFEKGIVYSADILFKEAREKCPHHPVVLYYSGLLETDGDSAAALLRGALANAPDAALASKARFRLGQYCYAKGAYAEAASFFKVVAESAADSLWGWKAREEWAQTLWLQGEVNQARALYQQILSACPKGLSRARAFLGLGDCAVAAREYAEAVARYTEALHTQDASIRPCAYGRLVRVYSESGDSASAKTCLSKMESEYAGSLFFESAGGKAGIMDSLAPDTVSQGQQFWVQVGAFSTVQNAKRFQKELEKELNIEGPLKVIVFHSESLELVRVGPFPAEEEALSYGLQKIKPLNQKFYIKTIP